MIFGYNGRDGVITDANGLLYMRARYYSPELRRFINADIIPGEISNAITLNRYAYANGNPVSNIDPFGLSAERENINQMESALNDIIDKFNSHNIEAYEGSILMGLARYYFSVSTTFGNGEFDISKIIQGQYDSLKSLKFSKDNLTISVSDDEIKLSYSENIDDVSSISASVKIFKTGMLNAEYTVTTKIDDKNSVSTTIGMDKFPPRSPGKEKANVPKSLIYESNASPIFSKNSPRKVQSAFPEPVIVFTPKVEEPSDGYDWSWLITAGVIIVGTVAVGGIIASAGPLIIPYISEIGGFIVGGAVAGGALG